MERKPINPWNWSLEFGYNQAELLTGAKRQLLIAGQTSVDAQGHPCHKDKMRDQIALTLDNVETLVNAAQMSLAHVVRLQIFTTKIDEALQHFDVIATRFGALNAKPPMTLLEVSRLAMPDLLVEIEATAMD